MKLYCSKALLEKIGGTDTCETVPTFSDPLDTWHAYCAPTRFGDQILLCLTGTGFRCLGPSIEEAECSQLDTILPACIRNQLESCGVPTELLDRYLPAGAALELCAAADGEPGEDVRVWNVLLDEIPEYDEDAPLPDSLTLAEAGQDQGALQLIALLQEKFGGPIPAMELELTLEGSLRTLVVPASTTFQVLHGYIQTLCGWHAYAVHEFVLPPTETRKSPLYLSDPYSIEALEMFGQSDVQDSNVPLQQVVCPGDTFLYRSVEDPEECREITCKVVRTYPAPSAALPYCIASVGGIRTDELHSVETQEDTPEVLSRRLHMVPLPFQF